jgi:hypothetical protein
MQPILCTENAWQPAQIAVSCRCAVLRTPAPMLLAWPQPYCRGATALSLLWSVCSGVVMHTKRARMGVAARARAGGGAYGADLGAPRAWPCSCHRHTTGDSHSTARPGSVCCWRRETCLSAEVQQRLVYNSRAGLWPGASEVCARMERQSCLFVSPHCSTPFRSLLLLLLIAAAAAARTRQKNTGQANCGLLCTAVTVPYGHWQ